MKITMTMKEAIIAISFLLGFAGMSFVGLVLMLVKAQDVKAQDVVEGLPDSGVMITQPAWESGVGEIDFVETGRVIFTISPLDEDGTFTVTLSPDIEWDEAGLEFWRLMERFAEPNRFNWGLSP